MNVVAIIIAILVFCVIIVLHELGHFFAAKACGIYVKEFAFGMGPVIFRKKGKETEYVIRALPIGGSCSFEGENGGYEDPQEGPENPRAFNRKPAWQRIIVIIAGPMMNLILGFIVVMISVCSAKSVATTTISKFSTENVSSKYLQVGDEIVSINGLHIFTSSDISYKLLNSDEKNDAGNLVYDVTVIRNGERMTIKDVEFATKVNSSEKNSVNIDFWVMPLERNFGSVLGHSVKESISTARLVAMTFLDMIRGKYGLNDLSGPIGTGAVISNTVSDPKYSFADFLSIFALITINVGVFNLIPIPALDGCRLIFLIIELIRRKPVKPEVEGMVHFVGFVLLMILMLVVTFNDISKLFTGGFS